jgi:integrase
MLTGQRREELGGLMWHEIAASEIRLPGERTKNKRPHTVPLSEPTLSILRSLHRRHNRIYLFGEGEGPFSGWSKSKARLDERIWRDLGGDLYAEFAARLNAAGVSKGRKNERDAAANRVAANLGYASAGALRTSIIPPWTLHDLRRTFSTHCADLGFGDQLTIDLATNHISGRGRISRTYTRAKMERQKRELMEKWGAHIHGLVEATGTESVSAGSATPEPQPITDTQSGPAASPMDRAAAFRYFLGRQRRTKRKSPRRRTQRSSL